MSRFIVLPARLLQDGRLTSMTHLRVLMALGSYTDKHGWAWPSRKKLADRMSIDGTAVSVNRVSQCIADLKAWGYLEVISQARDSDGSQTTNRYRVLFDIGGPEATPEINGDVPVGGGRHPVSGAYSPVNAMGLPPGKYHGIYPLKVPKNDSLKKETHSASAQAVDERFEQAWAAYPKRAGGNSKRDALKAWSARLAAGEHEDNMLAGTKRYAAFCAATGKVGTEYVKLASTFFGPARHFADEWALPTQVSKPVNRPQRFDPVAHVNRNRPQFNDQPDFIDV
ncbi:hypothetical protein CIC12_03645 [Burkholderia sp. SG-MS1]|uniref:helix-turn-helix domain-containing protein n=1 Tax=Paraburkholderia sp. SG-MS1 TaxID=2023741 RepID=UPI0014475CBD|nr:helix-turn-helix domain-containing protein [Paraburkholderia sp. SG-MS1]NKJ45850.1 hypothetical protein [Paraburkholderia sp. SG-MS1]